MSKITFFYVQFLVSLTPTPSSIFLTFYGLDDDFWSSLFFDLFFSFFLILNMLFFSTPRQFFSKNFSFVKNGQKRVKKLNFSFIWDLEHGVLFDSEKSFFRNFLKCQILNMLFYLIPTKVLFKIFKISAFWQFFPPIFTQENNLRIWTFFPDFYLRKQPWNFN